MNYATGASNGHQPNGGMNDHIINQSFITDMDDPALNGDPGYIGRQPQFEIDPAHIECEFTNVTPKSTFKKKILVVSMCGLGFLGAVAGALQMPQVKGFIDGSSAISPAAAAISPISGTVAQVPAALGTLTEKPPASLLPPENNPTSSPAEAVAPIGSVLASAGSVNPAVPPAVVDQPSGTTVVAAVTLPAGATATTPASLAAPASVVDTTSTAGSPAPIAPVAATQLSSDAKATAGAPVVVTQTDVASLAKPVSAKSGAVATPPARVAKAEPQAPVKQEAKPAHKQAAVGAAKPPSVAIKDVGEPRVAVDEDVGEAVKPLVTFSAGQIGLRSMSPDTLVLVSSKTNNATRYRVGDSLPSGDVIQYLDSNSMTVVTNRKVIRIIN